MGRPIEKRGRMEEREYENERRYIKNKKTDRERK